MSAPYPLTIDLTDEQRKQLVQARNSHRLAYIRERAAAVLKVADGQSARQVALHGLLRRRAADTVRDWVHRYESQGFDGLFIQPGRGRKPAFPP